MRTLSITTGTWVRRGSHSHRRSTYLCKFWSMDQTHTSPSLWPPGKSMWKETASRCWWTVEIVHSNSHRIIITLCWRTHHQIASRDWPSRSKVCPMGTPRAQSGYEKRSKHRMQNLQSHSTWPSFKRTNFKRQSMVQIKSWRPWASLSLTYLRLLVPANRTNSYRIRGKTLPKVLNHRSRNQTWPSLMWNVPDYFWRKRRNSSRGGPPKNNNRSTIRPWQIWTPILI